MAETEPTKLRRVVTLTDRLVSIVSQEASNSEREFSAELRVLVEEALDAREKNGARK